MQGNKTTKITVLYLCPDVSLGGSTRSLINLIVSVKNEVIPIVLLPSMGEAYDAFIKIGVECIILPYALLHHLHPVCIKTILNNPRESALYNYFKIDIKCAKKIKKLFINRRIDIVHSNFSPITVGFLLAKVLNAKHVWHVREFIDLDFHFDIFLGIHRLRYIINEADARIVISNAVAKHWHFKNSNTWIINNAIGNKQDIAYEPQKRKYILFSSYYITKGKGALRAIIAFGLSNVWKEGYTLVLMGNCSKPYKKELLRNATTYKCENYIKFIPCQTEVKPYFTQATAFVMASDCEALGRVTAEAMFWGCPVIAHATGGTLDLIKNGETGWLFNNEKECAMLIRKVCHESQEQIIMNAQQFVMNNLTQELYGPKILEVYDHVLKGELNGKITRKIK